MIQPMRYPLGGLSSTTKRHAVRIQVAVAIFFVIAARRPSGILSPQLWAEDGPVFYGPELILGFSHVIFSPYAGYLHVAPRLAVAMAASLSAKYVPMVLTLAALSIAAWACSMFCEERFASVVRSRTLRITACFAIASVPIAYELWGTITNVQWYLSIGCFLMLLDDESGDADRLKTFRGTVLMLVITLSAPQTILLMPVAIWRMWRYRSVGAPEILAAYIAGCSVQLATIIPAALATEAVHPGLLAILSATTIALAHEVVMTSMLGESASRLISAGHLTSVMIAFILFILLTISYCLYALPGARLKALSLLSLAALLVAAPVDARGLASYYSSLGSIQYGGERYYLLPITIFIIVVAIFIDQLTQLRERSKGGLLASCFIVGATCNFAAGELPNLHWGQFAPAIDGWVAAKRLGQPHASLTVPIPPAWTFTLPASTETAPDTTNREK